MSFVVKTIDVVEFLPRTRVENHLAGQAVKGRQSLQPMSLERFETIMEGVQ